MHGLNRRLKNIDAFQKERPLLFKENWETLISGDNGLVGFHLSKIGIHRQVKSHSRRQAVLCRDAQFELKRLVKKSARIQAQRIERKVCGCQRSDSLAGL